MPGLAQLAVDVPSGSRGVLVLGHGAGGDIEAADLLAAREVALAAGVAVVRVRQPYRVAGRKAPAPAAQLDQAFSDVVAGLGQLPGLSQRLPVLLGGRSSGARVAVRTATGVGAVAVLALAFPLSPPGRPQVSRKDELLGAGVPVLVVQGARDPFGSGSQLRATVTASGLTSIEVTEIADADHSFRTRKADPTTSAQSLAAVRQSVAGWLVAQLGAP
jgi:predicted alpha/beta-hydrolase family hydrolase